MQWITAQVEVICKDDSSGATVPCLGAAAKATVANGAGYTDWAQTGCNNSPCTTNTSTHRTYLYPFGGLIIAPGACDANVWAAVAGYGSDPFNYPTWIQFTDTYQWVEKLPSNFATPHYNVCESLSGTISYTPA